MVIIPMGKVFCAKGGIVPETNELKAIIHALIEERGRVVGARGDRYGELTIGELSSLIEKLEEYQKERGD